MSKTPNSFSKRSSIKDVRKKDPFPTPSPCPQVFAFDQPPSPLCRRPHLASYTALWSDSVISGALKICCSLVSSSRHFTPTTCGLICGSCNQQPCPKNKIDVGLSASPHYTLWCKSDKTNNNLYFNCHHP